MIFLFHNNLLSFSCLYVKNIAYFNMNSLKLFSRVLKARSSVSYTKVSAMSTKYNFETLSVTMPKAYVCHVELNRPDKLNAVNRPMWTEFGKCFEQLHDDEDCRVIVLSGKGKIFTAGIDFNDFSEALGELGDKEDVARKGKFLLKMIRTYQNGITALEQCQKPVLAAVHSACIGAGVDLITAADMRYCTKDAWFSIKEVDLGLAADVGTLQRLQKVVGCDSLVRELCYTGRKFDASEALSFGLVSRVFENNESMLSEVMKIAEEIASKSPVAVQGTKVNLVYSRDHSVPDGLDRIAIWNQMMLQSEDFTNAVVGQISKSKNIKFSKL